MAFKVLIVGGSVAGLTLANILERYGIDYILLEKHKIIAPQLGASMALWPYGLRILEQLGVYEKLSSMAMPTNKLKSFDPEGRLLANQDYLGDLFEELFGYRMIFLDRQQIIQTLFDNLRDKSKVHTSREVFRLEKLDREIELSTMDGSVFRGDIVVGADGVHSTIRKELWRLADAQDPSFRLDELSKNITCTYRCIFGISKRGKNIPDDYGFKTYRKNRSYLYQSGPDGKWYWFAFVKNTQKTIHRSIPQYTTQDMQKLAAEYADDILFPGLTFGDIYAQRMHAALVPLEEFVLDRSFYKRGILIGDAFHKVNPLTGHGGNSAVESAAILADMLKESLINESSQLDDKTVQSIFAKFQKKRQLRMRPLMEGTQFAQRLEILDNIFFKFISLKLMKRAGPAFFAIMLAEGNLSGYFLRYVPLEKDRGAVALSLRVKANPKKRPTLASAFWILMMLSISILSFLLPRYPGWAQNVLPKEWTHSLKEEAGSAFPTTRYNEQGVLQTYVSVFTVIINGLWIVESYRSAFFMTPLRSAIPFVLVSAKFGWEIVLPIYFAFHILLSQRREFYYPSPRAINVFVARALPLGLLIAYIIPTMQAMANIIAPSNVRFQASNGLLLSLAHVCMPIILHILSECIERKAPQISTRQLLYGSQDMIHQYRFFTILFGLASAVHFVFAGYFVTRLMAEGFGQVLAPSTEWMPLGSLGITVIAWCVFEVWDLRRVNIMTTSFSLAVMIIAGGSVLLGPAAVLAGLWRWRESAMEESRKRK